MTQMKDITGQKFGMLTAVKFHERKNVKTYWEFLCDCGNKSIKTSNYVISKSIIGYNPNCGCKEAETRSKSKTIHEMSFHPSYQTWSGMKKRCLNKNLKNWDDYGGRGITVCDRWLESFQNFWDDMGSTWEEGMSIDRINNDGNYEPSNCRWATKLDQAQNKRNNLIIKTPKGDMCVAEASRVFGINRRTIEQRVHAGWANERLLDAPMY